MNDIERAIKLHKELLDMAEYSKATYEDFCGTADLTEEERKRVYDDMDKNINVHKATISALEKQTEKTPEAHYIGEGDLSFECKVCEQTVNEGSFYCWYCGQNLLDEQWKNPIKAIGWSVEE